MIPATAARYSVLTAALVLCATFAADAQIAVPPSATNVALQEKCAAQSRQKYAALGWSNNPETHFTSHYNAALGKCFMLIESVAALGDEVSIFKTLVNVTDAKQFGLWTKLGDDDASTRCTVTMTSGEEQPCQSEEEFKRLVKFYMQ